MTALNTVASRRYSLLPVVLLFVAIFAPVTIDMYMPGLPQIAADFGVAPAMVNLTVTATLIGLALGQLLGGPISDRFGRRRIVFTGAIAYVAVSALCALMPTIETLIIARLIQGTAAGFAIIASQAAGRDLYDGKQLARFFARIAMAGGIAAAISPNIGAWLLRFLDWRGLFVAIAAIGALVLAVVALAFTETLAPDNRSNGGLGTTLSNAKELFRDRVFTGSLIIGALLAAALFGYISSAAFILQGIYGLNPQQFAAVVGVNAAGMVLAGFIGGRLAGSFGPNLPIKIGIGAVLVGGIVLLFGGLTAALPLPIVIAAMFTVAVGTAITSPAVSTQAVIGYPKAAGSAAALLGVARFGAGALIAPVVGLGNGESTLVLGLVVTAIAVSSVVTMRWLARTGQERVSWEPVRISHPTTGSLVKVA
ncbi:MAG: multidrug effflux MFS transporter [Promicromonosporaceae bacterium]|nr:multidrug effflux MFS transporter [Promicromonosporaceae bacterium]